jgi:runt-related transcription factor
MPYNALRTPPTSLSASHHSSISQQSNEILNGNVSRLSPASSRNSTSSPPVNMSNNNNNNNNNSSKINSSIELNSTNDQSSHHSSSDDSDDEHIDVVKSAFVPILRPTITATITTTTTPDSTVKEHSPLRDIPIKIKCELKAPSSKKPLLHEKALDRARSPIDTKIKSPTITQQHKTVWRPY